MCLITAQPQSGCHDQQQIGGAMNQHYADIVHRERMATLRGEADGSRLAAQYNSSERHAHRSQVGPVRRLTTAVAGLAAVILRRAG